MNVEEAMADARVLLRRGHKVQALALLERVVAEHPDSEPALAMLRRLRPSTRSAPSLSSSNSPAVAAKQAHVAPRVITRKVPFEESVRTSKDHNQVPPKQSAKTSKARKHQPKVAPGSSPCPICKASIRPGKMKTHFKHYHPRRGKKDALDYAVYFGDTAGVAMIKASRRKGGGR